MRVLGIESSCDDTAAAVYDPERGILSSLISSQNDVHARFGGIVPELASRRHIEVIDMVCAQALERAKTSLSEIKLIAATQGPGLVGSLLVGFTFAKALAMARGLPCVGVDHMAGHLLSCQLEARRPDFPYTALIVSGGNTSLFRVDNAISFARMGRTRDDAAGEAFDKVAKLLALGYPGGPVISRIAAEGNPMAVAFPRARLAAGSLDFSFSGLKTAVAAHVANRRKKNTHILSANETADICASFQEAVVDILVEKTIHAAQRNQHQRIALGGGVAANPRLRLALAQAAAAYNMELFLPAPALCTDNAAMIALAGWHLFAHGITCHADSDAYSRSSLN